MRGEEENLDEALSLVSGGGWVYWIIGKKNLLLYLIPVFILASFVLFRVTQKRSGKEADYVAAEVAFKQWEKGGEGSAQSLETLQAEMKKHPELESRYGSALVQGLIARRDFDHALFTAMKAIERSSDLAPYWADFGGTTLLIGKQDYKKALQEAERLKEEMLSDELFFTANESQKGTMLFGLNLMRIAFLHQKMGNPNEELYAWKQLKRFGGLEDSVPKMQKEAMQKLVAHFTSQNVSLLDYIRHREEICAKLVVSR